MSGPKAADVQLKVNRAVQVIEKQVREANATCDLYSRLGVSEAQSARQAARKALSGASWSEEARKHAGDEIRAAQSGSGDLETAVRRGESLIAEAEKLKSQAEQSRQSAKSKLDRANQLCQAAMNEVGQAGFLKHMAGFHSEDQWAKDAKDLAQAALSDEKEAKDLLHAAADKYRQARNAFDQAASGGARMASENRRIEELARQRQESSRIAEENKRNATQVHQEGVSLCNRIESMAHGKFAPEQFQPAKSAFDRIAMAFEKGNHEEVNRLAAGCLPTLRDLAEKVSKAQSEWEAAKKASENDLETVGKELSGLDRSFLSKWSGEGEKIEVIFRRLEDAKGKIAAEDFSQAQVLLSAALADARAAFDKATTSRRKFEQREIISEAIMGALYEQGYDAPTYYFNEKDAAGNDRELSDLTIFAKSPGNLGDMRMEVDLEGKVALNMENVPEGQEAQCVSVLNGLRDRLAGEVDFKMTDWGRAEGDSGKDREVQIQKQKERVQEKQRERQGG